MGKNVKRDGKEGLLYGNSSTVVNCTYYTVLEYREVVGGLYQMDLPHGNVF
jgi:hypothetical protein